MKVIFLDIDGVLNGVEYQTESTEETPLDRTRLELVRSLVEQSGAKVVLSSTRKSYWEAGSGFDLIFRECGVLISDITPILGRKSIEIPAYLKEHPEVEKFVIIDDAEGGWGELEPYVVLCDPIGARGIEQKDVEKALLMLA